jgi:hypothetical protein
MEYVSCIWVYWFRVRVLLWDWGFGFGFILVRWHRVDVYRCLVLQLVW